MRSYLLLLVILLPLSLSAQEIKSESALLAIEKYKAEIKRAEELKAAAEKQYKIDLEAALATAMKSGSLAEANVIKAALDGKEVVKETKVNKDLPPDEKIVDAKNLTLKLIDKHDGIIGSRPYKETYTLNLRAAKGKKITLNLNGVYRQWGLCVYEVYVNNVSAGNWELNNKSGEPFAENKTADLDITSIVKENDIKEYVVTFKPISGRGDINVTEVKAAYK